MQLTFPTEHDQDVGDVDTSFANASKDGNGKIVEAYYEYPLRRARPAGADEHHRPLA